MIYRPDSLRILPYNSSYGTKKEKLQKRDIGNMKQGCSVTIYSAEIIQNINTNKSFFPRNSSWKYYWEAEVSIQYQMTK